MSSICAGRFNFGFLLFSLAVLGSLSADTNSTTAGEIPDSSKDTELPVDKFNFVSSTLQTDNSIDGDPNLSMRPHQNVVATTAHTENKTDNLSTTETSRDSEADHNTSVESKPVTTPETNHQHNGMAIETTADQTIASNTDAGVSFSAAEVSTASEPVQNNTIQHQENINLQFIGGSLEEATDILAENKTTPANTKPTMETIMGIGVKTIVSVSLRLQDTRIISSNLTDVESNDNNCTYDYSSNATDTTNMVPSNAPFSETIENITARESINVTASSNNAPQNSAETAVLKSTVDADLQNNTEMSSNVSDASGRETILSTQRPVSTGAYFTYNTEVHSDWRNGSETGLNSTDNSRTEKQLNATETILALNITETTEESVNIMTERIITDFSSSSNATTDASVETNASQTTFENNDPSSVTTYLKTDSPTGTSLTSTSADMGNTSMDMMTTTSQPIVRYLGVMKIVSGLLWTEELGIRQSPIYKETARRIQLLLEDVFAGIAKEVEIDGFSQGSVLVDYYVTFVESDVPDQVHYLVHTFNSYFKTNNTFGDFRIDPQVTYFKVEKVKAIQPTAPPRVKPLLPQWVVAVVVIAAASLVFIILFAAVTIYGRHYGRRSYNKKLQGDEIIFDKPDYQSGPRLSDAAYENLAADAVYDVESSPEKSDVMIGGADYQFDSWRTNRLTRMPSSKRFSFSSS